MPTFKVATKIDETGHLQLKELPFSPGDEVEVIVRGLRSSESKAEPYPLRGLSYSYEAPTEPVAENDWEALG